MDIQSLDRFLLQQHLTLLVNKYEYFSYAGEERGELIAFAQQKRFAFREAITLWTDASRDSEICAIRAEKVLDVHGRYVVTDPEDGKLGYCEKQFGLSLIRSTWHVYDAQDQLVLVAMEQNHTVAIVRRVMQFVPFVAEFASIMPFNFVFEKDSQRVGSHTRLWGRLADQYVLELTPDLRAVDRRLILALGVLLDAVQDR